MFSAETYVARRKALMERVGSGIIVLLGNDEAPMNYRDNTYRYRQDSTFLYYFGLNHADLSAVMDCDSGTVTVVGDELTIDHIVWMGTQPTLKARSEAVGVGHTVPAASLKGTVREALSKNRVVHFLPPYRDTHTLKLARLLGMPIDNIESAASLDLVRAVVDQRNIKTAEEIEELDRAVSVSTDMHLAAYRMVRPGLNEAEVAAEVQRVAQAAGGDISFPIIATINGQTLHNHYHGNTLKSGDLFLLDAGAETPMGYAGDLSSTMPVDPTFTERQKEIYNIALDAHNAAIAQLKPGNPFRNAHLAACRTIAQGMKDMGFMKGDVDEAVATGAHAMFFQCGTGHMMGLDVHDMENLGEVWVGYAGEAKSTQFGLKSLRLARPLEPGFVVTVEPGIYFIPELIDLWKKENRHAEFLNYDKIESYRDFGGLRNEEDFVITEDGARLLGKKKPKTIEEVEALRQTSS